MMKDCAKVELALDRLLGAGWLDICLSVVLGVLLALLALALAVLKLK
jgi:hypothetical protein